MHGFSPQVVHVQAAGPCHLPRAELHVAVLRPVNCESE